MPRKKSDERGGKITPRSIDADQLRSFEAITGALASAHAIKILACFEENDALGTAELEEIINSRFGPTEDDEGGDEEGTQAVYGSKLRNPLMKLENVGLLSRKPKNDGTRAQNFVINKEALSDYREFLNRFA